MSGYQGGLQLSELLSAEHRRQRHSPEQEPSFSTLAPDPGGPAVGGALHGLLGLEGQVEPEGLPLITPGTLRSLVQSTWNLEEHMRNVADRVGKWPVADWHTIDRLTLSSAVNVDANQLRGNPIVVTGRAPTRRLTVYNPTQAVLLLGQGAGTALQSPAAIVPALSVLTLPWNADDYELATDSNVLGASDLAPVLVVRSARETDEICIDPIGNTVGGFVGQNAYGSTTPLPAAGVWTSPAIPMAPGFTTAHGGLFSDQAGNVAFQVWIAGAWRQFSTTAVVANTPLGITQTTGFPWVRWVYTNGATPQTVFEFAAWPLQ